MATDITSPGVAGIPDYLLNRTPVMFSLKAIEEWYENSIIEFMANTDYEGEIKAKGDRVTIRNAAGTTNIYDYEKNSTITYPQITTPDVTLIVDKAKGWSFGVDKIDKLQFDKDYMSEDQRNHVERLREQIQAEFLEDIYATADATNQGAAAGRVSQNVNLGTSGTPRALTKADVTDFLVDCNQVLNENNVPTRDRYIVLPPPVISLLKKSDLKAANITGDDVGVIRNGMVGQVDGFNIIPSNQVPFNSGTSSWNCSFGHKYAVTWASQITESEILPRLENTHGAGYRGLRVYGYKTIKEDGLGLGVVSV